MSELRRLRQGEEESSRLKRLIADRSLDKHMFVGGLAKNSLWPALRLEVAPWFHGIVSDE